MHRFLQVATTTSSADEARVIARGLVEQRLAACVQIDGPIESVYRWQGAVETSAEWRLAIKCRQADFAAVAAAIRRLHRYDVPEVVALPIVAGSDAYLAWLDAAGGGQEG